MIECLCVAGWISFVILTIMAYQSVKQGEEIRQDKMYLFRKETDNDDHSKL